MNAAGIIASIRRNLPAQRPQALRAPIGGSRYATPIRIRSGRTLLPSSGCGTITTMELRLEQMIRQRYSSLTRAEKPIATYFFDNLRFIPYETGASIAARVGVSEMTVIRFLRSIGYSNLKELKEEIRQHLSQEENDLDNVLERFKIRTNSTALLKESLNLEIRSIVRAYELAGTDRWARIADLLATIERVHVVGFQASKGLALDFATRLKYARPGVLFIDDVNGIYSEVLESDPARTCLVLIDTASYARSSSLLAKKVRDAGMSLIIVTDKFSHWASEYTEYVLEGYTHAKTFWDSTASLAVILNLLTNAVATKLGKRAEDRFKALRQLGDFFKEFDRSR